ncbi:MAG: thioredoxin [Bacteroidota bacterium]
MILTDKNFEATIKSGIVMVDFYATWCGPCKTLSPRIEEIAQETNKKIKICKVDTDKCPLASTKYNIKYLPTVIIFKNGEAVSRFVGLQEKETLVIALKAAQEK